VSPRDRLRVAFVTQYPRDPQRPKGGVEAVSATLVPALARLGDLDVVVVTSDDDCGAYERSEFDGVEIHRLPRTSRRILREATGPGRRRMHRLLAELRPDVVHSHDVYGLMVQDFPAPRVFTVHGFISADTRVSGESLPRLRSLLWRFVETRGWAEKDHVVSISPYVRERLAGIVRGRIQDIENPVAETFFETERREEPGTVFCAGLIERRKNTLALVEALGKLRAAGVAARLRLAGSAREPDYAKGLASRIEAAGLRADVDLLGPLPRAAVREELARASVFALVSLEENAPMGIAEAMAAGVPVVASDRCGMPYMVREAETGFLVNPLDVGEITDRLALLLADDARRRRMSEAARAEARRRFHPDVVARRTRDVYWRAALAPSARAERP